MGTGCGRLCFQKLARRVLGLAWIGMVPRLDATDPFLSARPAMRAHSSEQGLPDDSVYSLSMDRMGRLWSGTIEGTAYLTGQGWRNFPLPAQCPSRLVRAILETQDGALWFGTIDGGLWRYKDLQWTGFRGGQALPHDRVNSLLEIQGSDGSRELWVSTAGGVARLKGDTWARFQKKDGLPDDWVWKLREIRDAQGVSRIWAATRKGVATWDGQRWKLVGDNLPPGSYNDVLGVKEKDGRTSIWLSGWGLGLLRGDGQSWQKEDPSTGFPSLHPACLSAGLVQGEPTLWVGTYDQGVIWGRSGQWRSLGPEQGFPSQGVFAILAIPKGKPDVWVGSRGGGAVSLDTGAWRVLDEKRGLPSPEVTCIWTGAKGEKPAKTWLGTNRGLAEWDGDRFRSCGHPPEELAPHIHALRPDSEGKGLWVSTLNQVYWVQGSRWNRIWPAPGFKAYHISSILEQEVGQERLLWIGSQQGLACRQKGRWTLSTTKDGLPSEWISALHGTTDSKGRSRLWVGTWGGGIGCLHEGRWKAWGIQDGLPSPTICTLRSTRSRDGRLWIWAATLGGGLARLEADRVEARWERFGTEKVPGLRSNSLGGLEATDRLLYVTGPRGVARIVLDETEGDPRPIRAHPFTTGDGLPSNTCIMNATWLDPHGRICVGTNKGLAILDPRQESFCPPPEMPHLLSLEILGKPAPLASKLILGYRDRRIDLRFFQRVHHRSEELQFQTQVLGLEPEPTPWSRDDARQLTGLPPGDYQLKVWSRDHEGRVSAPFVIPIAARPAPWNSPWARALYLVLLGSMVYGFFRLRTRYLQKRAEDLERSVQSALAEVKTLTGMIPICAYCKKIRDDQGSWAQLEEYIAQRSEAQFSHGICPDCRKVLVEEMKERGS